MPFPLRLFLSALAVLAPSLCHAVTLSHRYSFDNDASDSVGGIDGVLVDDANVSGGELNLDGAPNGPSGDSMAFSSTIGIASNFGANGVTFETWYTDQGSGTWSKLFSFGNGTAGSNIIFNLQQAGSGQGRIQYQGMPEANFGQRPSLGAEHHLALTISPEGVVNAWIDGTQINASPPNLSGDGNNLSGLPNSWERIGASAWNDANMFGSVNEFRVWDGTFTAAEVAESLAAGPDNLPGNGPRIDSFTASPAARFEGENATLAWIIDESNLGGSLAVEVRDPGNTVIHSSSSDNGNISVTMGDTGGTAQDLTYTLRTWDTAAPGDVRTRTVDISVDPGIPTADDQSLQTQTTTPLPVTLTGSDPNSLPNPLSFSIESGPSSGMLAGTAPNLSYTANGGFTGTDTVTFKASDGKYDSPLATVSIEIVPEPSPPSDIVPSTTDIGDNVIIGGRVATLQADDPNPGDTHGFGLVPGAGSTDNGLFAIVGNELRAAADFSTQVGNSFSIRLRVTDNGGLVYDEVIILTVIEVSNAIVINEIHFNPPDNTVRQEFIELYNPDTVAADLSGWRISGAVNFTFPAATSIPGEGYLVIAEDPPTLLATLNANALGPFTGSLNSDGETVRLRDQNDVVVDEADYKVGFPWPVIADGGGASIELVNPALNNSLGSSWRGSVPQDLLGEATLLPLASSTWSWRPGSTEASNPSSAWRQPGFVEDGSWTKNVQTLIGYGDVGGLPFNTEISGMQSNYSCIFLRNTFTVAPGEIPNQLLLRSTSDDGIVVWINGVEVERRRYSGTPAIGTFGTNQGNEGAIDTKTVLNPGSFLVEGSNTIAAQVFNGSLGSSDLGFDIEVLRPAQDEALPIPTPSAPNTALAANAAPNIRKVKHTPEQPTSADPIVITAKVTDPDGVASVSVEYQIVAPGSYVPSTLPLTISGGNINLSVPRPDNPAYETGWTSLTMLDDGNGDDALGSDDFFTATIPAQTHRHLVRYRITIEDALGLSERVPYSDDASLNFACFVYNGVPDYNGHSAATLQTLPVYHIITRGEDYAQCLAYNGPQISQGTQARFFYNWNATIVYDGVVYDNIRYRLRGANGRYHNGGKRSMRFRLNDGYFFQARDRRGRKYAQKWRTLTTGKGFDNKSTLTYGLNEAVNMFLYEKVGVPAIFTHSVHWRVIDGANEAPDRWRGDFHGLNFILETYDVRFMEEHGLEKGNLYKLINQTGDWQQQQRYQSAIAPNNGSDHNLIEGQLDGGDSAAFISAHVNMEKWNLWHAMVEAIRHYDYWPSANKNMVYYFEPDYQPANGNNGKLWILPWDTDASWGPNWNNGHDVAYNALFDASGGGSDNNSTPELWSEYFNTMREIRDLLWQPDQIEPVIDEIAAYLLPMEAADADRWKGAPTDAGNYNGLGGAGAASLSNLVQDMKNFAFSGWSGGSGPNVGAGGRAAFLDQLQGSQGEAGQIPNTPTITYTGAAGFPTNGLAFQSSAFSDPQGSGTFGAMEWRVARITDPNAPAHDPTEPFKLEWEADWESGELNAFDNAISIPTVAVRSNLTYRARVRHQDSSGRWSHWSAPFEFTTTLPDISDYLAGLVVSEVMYHPADPNTAELNAGYDDDDFFEYIELQNVGNSPLDLADLRFTKGVDFDFLGSAITSLAPGGFVLVVNNKAAFELRYGPGLPIAGAWQSTDKLDNGGEQLKLSFGAGDGIRDFVYDDVAPWPTAPDGGGVSLTLVDPDSVPDHTLAASWRGSFAGQGTPGTDESGSPFGTWLAGQGSNDPLAPFGTSSLSNLLAYSLGADLASSPESALPAITIVADGGSSYPALSYRVRKDATEVTYAVEVSTDIVTWESGPAFTVQIGAPQENGDGTETTTVRTLQAIDSETRQLMRLRVTVTP